MKKTTIVLLILLVLGILGACIFYVLNPADISYVNDYEASNLTDREYLLRRLYSSDIDSEKMAKLASTTLSTAFTDDEIQEAALKAGTPQFYPTFYCNVTKLADGVELDTKFIQGLAEGQVNTNYAPSNVTMEIVGTGFSVTKSEIYAADNGTARECTPMITEDGTNLAVFYEGTSDALIDFTGTTGTIMLQYRYDIKTSGGLIAKTALTDQIVIIYINITNDGDTFKVTYSRENVHLVSEFF